MASSRGLAGAACPFDHPRLWSSPACVPEAMTVACVWPNVPLMLWACQRRFEWPWLDTYNRYNTNNRNILIFIKNQPKFKAIQQVTSRLWLHCLLLFSNPWVFSFHEAKLFLPVTAPLSARTCSSRHYLVQMGSVASTDTTVLLTPYKRLSWLP